MKKVIIRLLFAYICFSFFSYTSALYPGKTGINKPGPEVIKKGTASPTYKPLRGSPQKEYRKKVSFSNQLSQSIIKKIDIKAEDVLKQFQHLNIAIVKEGKIVLTKVYGDGDLNATYAYASVSKPVTSTIIMQLVAEGKIKSIDDNIGKYSKKYKNSMPQKYATASLTIRHLLTHTSGIPHNDEPTWKEGKLNLKFKPGTAFKYSTPGYGVLGDIIESVTGKSYEDALKAYIGKPVNAFSFNAFESFITPGAFVYSSIKDMALFSIGVMNGTYINEEMLYGQVLKPFMRNYGLGWGCTDIKSKGITALHSGSNGAPKAYLLIKPREKTGFCLLATQKLFDEGNRLREFIVYLKSLLDEGME